MRCYRVLVHGALTWAEAGASADHLQPDGFYTHRFILAPTEASAARKALRRVRDRLEADTGWLSTDRASLKLEAEEIAAASPHHLLKGEVRGFSFY